jgi:predicted RNase H-like nuclease (RuvC/YqgF family)
LTDAELSVLRDSDVSKLTRELEREKIKRKQLEAKLKKVKQDHDSTPKLRLCCIIVQFVL